MVIIIQTYNGYKQENCKMDKKTMTQTEFAEFYGVSQPMVSRYIRDGKIPRDALIQEGNRQKILPGLAVKYLEKNLSPGQRKTAGLTPGPDDKDLLPPDVSFAIGLDDPDLSFASGLAADLSDNTDYSVDIFDALEQFRQALLEQKAFSIVIAKELAEMLYELGYRK